MKRHWLFLGMVGALLVGTLTPAALAEEHPAVFCGGLAAGDCALLQGAAEAANAQPFGTADFEIDLLLTTFGDDAPLDQNFVIRGSGTYAVAPALLERTMAIESDPSLLAGDGLAELLDDLVAGFAGDLDLNLSLPPDMTADFMAPDENGSFSGLAVKLRMVEGKAYIDTSTLAMLMGGSANGMSSLPGAGGMEQAPDWVGIDMSALLEQMMGDMDMMGMPDMDDMDMPSEQELLEQFSTIKRVADSEGADGQPLAVFHTVIDLKAMLQSPIFTGMIMNQMAAGEDRSAMSEAEASDAMAMMQDGLAGIELTLSSHESIGLEDGLRHGMEALMTMDTDASASGEERMAMRLHMEIGYRDHGVKPEIVAPEGAFILPLEAMTMGGRAMSAPYTNDGGRPLMYRAHGKSGADSDLLMEQRIAALEMRATALEVQLMEQRIAALEARIAELETRLGEVGDD